MKKWWKSKTIWANVISMTGLMLQAAFGEEVLSPEAQTGIMSLVNIGLRIFTNQGLE